MGYSKIEIHGKQICDYMCVLSNSNDNIPFDYSSYSYVDSEPETWTDKTLMLAKFKRDLTAGNSMLTSKIDGYELRRSKGANTFSEHVSVVPKNSKFVVDYLTANNSSYTYYLYPVSGAENNEDSFTLPPLIMGDIKTNWDYWTLLVVDESEFDNVFYLDKMFKFELNFNENEMNNNTPISVTQNFTRYPTVQYGTSNYWSGSLSALCGFIASNDQDYIQTPNMLKELKSLTSESRKMFLKDIDGNVMEIKITSPISITTENSTLQKVKTVNISWAEVGDVDGVSVVNNPNKSTTEWILTENGVAVPYSSYVWGDQYIWDDSFIWTENSNVLGASHSNSGRAIYDKESD